MFRFTMKSSSGSQSKYLAKITRSIQCEVMEVVHNLSVLWLHSMTCEAWVHSTHVSQVIICSHNTDNYCRTSMCSHWIECVILAKYWLWFPDDRFIVNRNMLEQFPLFYRCFNNSTLFNVVCIIWDNKKCSISLMHGVTMNCINSLVRLSIGWENVEIKRLELKSFGLF